MDRDGATPSVRQEFGFNRNMNNHSEFDLGLDPFAFLDGKTILLIEDEILVRKAASAVLRQLGCTVFEAENSALATALFLEHAEDIDLVFCDVVLPDATGVELCRKFQSRWPQLKVLLASGYPETIVGSPSQESSEFLIKPYTSTSLIAAIRRLLGIGANLGEGLLRGLAQRMQQVPRQVIQGNH
jgi:DNA-binding NtrC family response regulator